MSISTFPAFLSYHDLGIGSTPHEKIVKGFNTFLEKFVTYPSLKNFYFPFGFIPFMKKFCNLPFGLVILWILSTDRSVS
jgi:hypothetical protein